jgi:hypothetical protein
MLKLFSVWFQWTKKLLGSLFWVLHLNTAHGFIVYVDPIDISHFSLLALLHFRCVLRNFPHCLKVGLTRYFIFDDGLWLSILVSAATPEIKPKLQEVGSLSTYK